MVLSEERERQPTETLLTSDIRENKTADGFLVLSGLDDGVFPAAGQPRLTPGPGRTVL